MLGGCPLASTLERRPDPQELFPQAPRFAAAASRKRRVATALSEHVWKDSRTMALAGRCIALVSLSSGNLAGRGPEVLAEVL